MTSDDLSLDRLSDAEIASLAMEFATISGVAYPQIAAWATRWHWITTSELADRAHVPRGPAPMIVTLTDLPEAQLMFARSFFAYELPVLADALGAERLADWCRAMGRRAAEAMGQRARDEAESSAVLKDYIQTQRRDRPLGTPGDVTGIAPWSAVSSSRPDHGDES